MRRRACRNGCRSAWTSGIHQGEACGIGIPDPYIAVWRTGCVALAVPKMLARGRRISMLRPTNPAGPACAAVRSTTDRRILPVKVIASSLRKGNIVELEGKLYVILTAENIHPGKGTP